MLQAGARCSGSLHNIDPCPSTSALPRTPGINRRRLDLDIEQLGVTDGSQDVVDGLQGTSWNRMCCLISMWVHTHHLISMALG